MRSTLLLSIVVAGCGNAYTYLEDAAVPDMAMKPAPDLSATNPSDCDLVAQDCKVAPNTRCTIVLGDPTTQTPDIHQCVPPGGTNMAGQPCTRTDFGADDCVAGTVCTLRGVATGSFACRKWCHSDSDCAQGEQCSGQVSTTFSTDGMCMPTCAPFSSGCGAGETCGWVSLDVASTMTMPQIALLCRSTGIAQQGDTCSQDSDCIADSVCVFMGQSGTCAQLCDNGAHACPMSADADAGVSCMGGGAFGLCQ